MENNAIIKCTNVIDDSFCTVIILKYKVYRDDTGKLFGRLLVLKHKVENFLKEVLDEDLLYQNPVIQRAKDGLLDLFQGLTSLCSGISTPREMLRVPELPLERESSEAYEMKFVKGSAISEVWLCYVDNANLLSLLKRVSEKYENDELEPCIFYPRIGEHVYFKQGQNIFRGIVQEYVIPDESEDEERVDVKVLNMDNSDIIILPQNCIFQMDKDGIELPMQCVLCSLQEVDTNATSVSSSNPLTDLSIGMLKKHELNVTFLRKTVVVENTPNEAQCVTIDMSVNKLKDKKNGFNVNSKEFVPRNSIPNEVPVVSNSVSEVDLKSDKTTCSSSHDSSQGDAVTKETVVSVETNDNRTVNQSSSSSSNCSTGTSVRASSVNTSSSVKSSATSQAPASAVNHHSNKDRIVDNKSNVINYTSSAKNGATNTASMNTYRSSFVQPQALPHDKERNPHISSNAVYNRYSSSKIDNSAAPSKGKSMSAVADKLKNMATISSPGNENRSKASSGSGVGPMPSSPHASHPQSPANMPPNAQMPPYLFLPPGHVHFPSQYVPIPAGAAGVAPAHHSHQLSSSMPLFLPPYPPAYLPPTAAAAAAAVVAPPPPASAHSQAAAAYHMPPASSPYQPYMQPMAVTPFFSQPPFSQQFYQTSHLQPSWSHLPPSFHIGGGGGGGGVAGMPLQGNNAGGMGKPEAPSGHGMSSKYK